MANKKILLIAILGGVEGLLRLVFYFEAVFAGVSLLSPMPPATTMLVVNSVNLALGIAGIIAISGLLLTKAWGYWGTVGVSIATIAFDGVSAATVSFTAFAGLILPVAFLLIMLPGRASLLGHALGGSR